MTLRGDCSRYREVRLAARTITLSLLVFLSIAASADTLSGKVVKVADGDSITVLDNTNTQHPTPYPPYFGRRYDWV